MLRSVWCWPALTTLLLGLYRITTPEPWRDEISSWSAANRTLPQLFAMLGNVDASNGVYYLVLHAWTGVFGDSVLSLRLPSALAMAAAAAFTALAALRWFRSRVAAVAAGLLLAALPNVSAYAQEARSYAIVTCAVAAGGWCLLRALERPRAARWAWYGLCTALAGVFHLVSLSSLAGQCLLVGLHFRSVRDARVLRRFPVAALAALLPTVPVMLLGRRQSGRQLDWVAVATRHRLRMFWPEFLGSFSVMYAFLALAAAALLWRGRRTAAVQAAALAVLPVLGVWLVSQGRTSYFVDRYLLFTLPAWAALAGGGVGAVHAAVRALGARPAPPGARDPLKALPRAWRPTGPGLAAALALAVVAVPGLLGLPEQRGARHVTAHTETDYRGAARLVASGYRDGDGLVAVGGRKAWMMVGPGVAYHLPGGVRPRPLLIARTAVRADDLFPTECPVPVRCIGDVSRTWVVTIGTGDDPYQALPADQAGALRAVFTPSEVRHVRGLTVSLLVRARGRA
ncbi:glycosyltransferase family 39 protein [Kitasatospora sp. HPMI-4]|uniref:glycosyltransferase family 39 protein n=1 Tax=Kitasatospora sp. HPMI-4 TaxID=3448443 RepID=UPI003F194FF3